MHDARRRSHDDCFAAVQATGAATVMDIGCGMGVGWADRLADRRFIGVDLEPRSIAWCTENRANPAHSYHCRDILQPGVADELAAMQPDFVFSSGTIDNTWTIDGYLAALARITNGWLYVTAYRGWFPDLPRHRYMWEPTSGAYYNDLSPNAIRSQLSSLGFKDIEISPIEMGNPPPQATHETRIMARKG
jgi:SAM-dependent methyltransferase